MKLPDWEDVPEKDRKMMVGLVQSFGLGEGDAVKFPDEKLATMWSIEMYCAVRLIISRMSNDK